MILKSLTLKNFRKIKHAVIDFPDGVTGVVGLNGVGKSTIFEAIAWVLYGSVAARTSADQIKRNGAEHSDPCRVELEFVFEDDNYRVVREMSGKSLAPSASVLVNNRLAVSSAENTSKYIQKKLGMDFKSFFTSIFARQKELNMLSAMNASERRPLILKMLGIDALDEIIKEIKTDRRNKDELIKKLSLDLVDETGKSRIEVYKTEIEDAEQKKNEIDLLIKHCKENISVLEKELYQLEQSYNVKKDEYEKINQYKEKLSERKTIFERKKKLQEEIKDIRSKINERQNNIKKEKEKVKRFENIDKEIKEVENKLDKICDTTEEIIKKIEQKKTLMKGIEKDIKDIKSKEKKIEEMGPDAHCPTCDRVLGKQYDVLLEKFDKEKQKKNNEIDSILKIIKTEEESYERLSRQEQALQKRRKYLQGLIREKERIDTTINNLSKEIEREELEIDNKKKQIDEIGDIEFDIEEYNSVKNQVNEFYRKYQSSINTLNEKKDQLSNKKLELKTKEGELNLILQQIKNLQQRLAEQKRSKKMIEEESKNLQYLSMLADIMSSFRTYLISRVRPTLSSYASDFLERLTDGKYNEIELDEDYNLMIYDDGNRYNIERFSGGEEDLANLCLRLAISEVITERAGGAFNFIILDEIFGSQDTIRRQNIMKALNSLSSKFRQIFLITHIEDVKNFTENTIMVMEDESGISKIKIE